MTRGRPIHCIISLLLFLLALFYIVIEECRHLRLKQLPFCVWSSLSSLCLNCHWAQLGLCFQYPFSTLHIIRKENQEWQSHLLPRPFCSHHQWLKLEAKEVVTWIIVPLLSISLHLSDNKASPAPEMTCLIFYGIPSLLFLQLFKGQGALSKQNPISKLSFYLVFTYSRKALEIFLVSFWSQNNSVCFLSTWGLSRYLSKEHHHFI